MASQARTYLQTAIDAAQETPIAQKARTYLQTAIDAAQETPIAQKARGDTVLCACPQFHYSLSTIFGPGHISQTTGFSYGMWCSVTTHQHLLSTLHVRCSCFEAVLMSVSAMPLCSWAVCGSVDSSINHHYLTEMIHRSTLLLRSYKDLTVSQ